MLMFERKFNKYREKMDKKIIYFECHKEGHNIHSFLLHFPHLKNNDDNNRQDKKEKYTKGGYKGKRKVKTMNEIGCRFR
jgi:hypothetical protein